MTEVLNDKPWPCDVCRADFVCFLGCPVGRGREKTPSYCEPLTKAPPEDYDCSHENECVCPYCGDVNADSWELGTGGEEDGETECGSCGRPYTYQRHVSVSYSTHPIIGPHPEKT